MAKRTSSDCLVYHACDRNFPGPIAADTGRFRVAQDRGHFENCKRIGIQRMGMSDPEARKKLSEARWLHFQHESEKQTWPWWTRLLHRFQPCPVCKPEKPQAS